MRLIYYSLVRPETHIPLSDYELQWIQSIRSLRSHNTKVPVTLFVFNSVSEAVRREAESQRVMVISLGGYREWLQRYHPHGEVLAFYPTLHKFLVLTEADTTGLTQTLYVDCDTFFYSDPEVLFETATPLHWCAREELRSRLCPFGYDPTNIDEEQIQAIMAREGLRWVAPFNSGVCLLNNGIWNTFRQLECTFFDTAWRLLVGYHCWGAGIASSDRGIHEAVLSHATSPDVARCIPYPSTNGWILEEIAVWLTLAHVRNLEQGVFERQSVMQGYECIHARSENRRPVVAHYFSSLQEEFFRGQPQL